MTTSLVWFILLLFRFAGPTPLQPYSLRLGTGGIAVSEFIKRYEPCVFDQEAILRQHKRIRRSIGHRPPPPLHIHLKTNQRDFRLKLFPDKEVFSDDVTFETGSGKAIHFDPGKAYVGTLQDEEENSSVRGVVTEEGLFDGLITTPSEEYYVEPTSRYSGANVSATFHSIVYRGRDVIHPRAPRSCRSALLHTSARRQSSTLTSDSSFYYLDRDTYEIRKANRTDIIIKKKTSFIDDDPRHKRTTAGTIDHNKTTCMLYLQADHLFYQKYATEEACIEVMTRHVQRVNAIYKTTDFDQDGRPDNIGFMIKRIKVHTTESLNDQSYRFPGNYGVEKFLELFSEEDYDAFCLAYMFTYRDFEMGTLGLAWTGDLKNAGGVCEKNGHYRGSMKSLNTGIVTLLNYGKHVPPAVSHVTLAHEIGHNFGSPHDPEQCTPGGEDGNFIMFARATSGDKKNNNRFSPCSLASINPVLNSKARSTKGCFTEPQGAICGNGVVEKGEQCDCGWEEDCKEDCCYPQRRHPPPDQPPCHLTPHSVCSPSQGPCCTPLCSLKFGDKCRDDNGCRDSSYCDGMGPHCPPSINKPNKTICNEEFVCFMGECTGSICLAYGLESCQCIPSAQDPPTKACELCCKLPGENKPCMSSFYWNTTLYEMPILFSKPGTPCNDYNGYCDVFQKCREVDPSGPLATLRKLLLSEQSIASFKRWVMDRWYYALLIVASVILILVLSTRLLGKTTDLKLKAITIIHSSTTETVRLPADGEIVNTVVVHPGVSSKLPLKRKVRGGPGVAATRRIAIARTSQPTEVTKQKKASKKKKIKKNEVIDYSRAQEKSSCKTPDEDPLGKVRNWLLNSHIDRTIVRKSKSSPAGFLPTNTSAVEQRVVVPTTRPAGVRGDKEEEEKRHRRRTAISTGAGATGSKRTPSSSKEQMKLQVMYKPPFKFSLKLKKPSQVATTVVKEINSKVRRPRTAVLVRQNKRNHKKKPSGETKKEGESGGGTSPLSGDQEVKSEATTAVLAPPIVARLISVEQSSKEPLYQNTGEAVQDLLRMSSVEVQSTKQQPLLEEPYPATDTIPSDLEVLLSESEFLFSSDT